MSGETFLENELNIISKSFDKILIFPINASVNSKKTRKITAKNIEVIPYNSKEYENRKFIYILNSMKYLFNKENEGKTIKEMAYESYFLSICYVESKKILKKLDNIKFNTDDEIYIYSYWLYTSAKIATILKEQFKKRKLKTVAFSRAHGFDIYADASARNYLPQRNALISQLDKIFTCSKNGEEYLIKKYHEANKIETSYLGTIDHGITNNSHDDIFRIVSCSRMVNLKRIDLIIDALKKLKNSNLKFEWTHIGGGNLFEHIQQRVDLELKDIKVNLLGSISNSEVYSYYKKHSVDLFINVSSTEGLPVSIMEAISFGIPIIATDVGGTSEIVVDNENGFLIDKNFDIEDLSSLILKIANTKSNKYGIKARLIWEKKYNAKDNYKKFIKSILKL